MDALAAQDALRYKAQFQEWQAAGLRRPLELLFDDGEYLGWYNNLAHALEQDPVILADYAKLAIAPLPGGQRDWATYTSMWRAKNTQSFKRVLLRGSAARPAPFALFRTRITTCYAHRFEAGPLFRTRITT